MKTFAALVVLLLVVAEGHARVEGIPVTVQVVGHGWMGLAFSALMLPLLRWRRSQSVGFVRLQRKSMGANQMHLLDEENSPVCLTSSIGAVDRYPCVCSRTASSSTDC